MNGKDFLFFRGMSEKQPFGTEHLVLNIIYNKFNPTVGILQ